MIDLEGAIDLHVHTAPDVYPRSVSDHGLVADAAAAGMRGLVLKSHHTLTADRAQLALEVSGRLGVQVFGGLVLNQAVGGLNVVAVETALELGARTIWLPTIHASHCLHVARIPAVRAEVERGRTGISVTDERGRVSPETRNIMEVVRDGNAILATGHLGPAESLAVLRAARDLNMRRLLVTHPLMSFTRFDHNQMREASDLGAVLEFCALSCVPQWHDPVTPSVAAAAIRAVGPEHCVLASDGGQAGNPSPPEMLHRFARDLQREGLAEAELKRMLVDNPAELLGLKGP